MSDQRQDTTRLDQRPRRRRGFGIPLVLIAVGLAALIGNTGIAPVSWGNILALWPLLLVIAGVDLLLAHRAPLAALALDVVVVCVGLVLLVTRPLGPTMFPFFVFNQCPSGTAQSSVSLPKGSLQNLALHFTGGAGTFTITGGAADLVDARSDTDELYLRTSGSDVRVTQCVSGRFAGGGHEVTVQIASDVPTSLDVTGGAGTFDVDLRNVKLTDARFTNGASTTDVRLPKPSGDVPIRFTGGAATVTFDLGGAEASVDVTGGLTSLNAPNGGGGSTIGGRTHWESPGYSSTRDRYTITVTGGASTITVR